MSKTKLLFIGIDAADQRLIRLWARDGLLPNFQRLLANNTWGITENPIGFYVGAVWPSFYTGRSPAQHERYCFQQLIPGRYATTKFRTEDVKGQPFWQALSDAGKRVAVIDVPKTSLAQQLNGLQIVDWGTHDPDYVGQLYAYPEALGSEIEQAFGRDPVGDCNTFPRTMAGYQLFLEQLLERVQTKTALSRHYLDQGDWDLFLTVFTESHCVGHQCWNLSDPQHPQHDPEIAQALGDPLLAVYQAIDQGVGELIAAVGPETPTVVMTSHGMGPHYDGTFMLDDILRRLEQAHLPAKNRQPVANLLRIKWEDVAGIGGLITVFKKRVFKPLQKTLFGTDEPIRKILIQSIEASEQAQRQCFTVPNNDVYGAVRINLVGREPHGQIQPGEEYEAFCHQLTADLKEIINCETGKPLVKRVLKTADLYPGINLDLFPDLLIEWHRTQPIRQISSPKIGTIEKTFQGVRTGDHQMNGMFLTQGLASASGQLGRAVSVMDFAPTAAELLGVALAQGDGQVIDELISS